MVETSVVGNIHFRNVIPLISLLLSMAFIEAQKSCYWGIQRYHEKTVSGSVFPKGEIGKLRPSL